MRPLIINDETKAEVQRVLRHAEANAMSWAELQARATGAITTALGSDPAFRCVLPMGYVCVFCFEMQRAVKMRYLSVSVADSGKWPNELAVDQIAQLFGFKHRYNSGKIQIDLNKPTQSVMFREVVE